MAYGDNIVFIVKSAIFLLGVHKNAAHLLDNMKWNVHKYNGKCPFSCDVCKMQFNMLSYLKGVFACGMGNALCLVLCKDFIHGNGWLFRYCAVVGICK